MPQPPRPHCAVGCAFVWTPVRGRVRCALACARALVFGPVGGVPWAVLRVEARAGRGASSLDFLLFSRRLVSRGAATASRMGKTGKMKGGKGTVQLPYDMKLNNGPLKKVKKRGASKKKMLRKMAM